MPVMPKFPFNKITIIRPFSSETLQKQNNLIAPAFITLILVVVFFVIFSITIYYFYVL